MKDTEKMDGLRTEYMTTLAEIAGLAVVRTNRLEIAPTTSCLSPVCVEGSARWPLLAAAFSGTNAVTVRPGVAGRWFADLPLYGSGDDTPLAMVFENGANTAAVSVAWVPLDLISAPATLAARLGDTLRVTVLPPPGVSTQGIATLEISVAGVPRFSLQVLPGSVAEVPFDADGSWAFSTVWTGTDGQSVARTLTAAVYAAPLPAEDPACMLGRSRVWDCPGVTPGAVLQTDAGVSLVWRGTNATLTVNRMYAEHFVVARAGAGGPVLDSRQIKHFWIQSAVDSYLRMVEKRADSQIWQNRMVSLCVPAGVEIELRIFVGGVTFDDLSIVRWVSGANLGQAGDYYYRMIHPDSSSGSTCHTMKAYQGGVLLGEAYHAQVGLPADLR